MKKARHPDKSIINIFEQSPADRQSLHEDRHLRWTCPGCGGRVSLHRVDWRYDARPSRVAPSKRDRLWGQVLFEIPFVHFVHYPGEGAKCRALGYHIDESVEHLALKGLLGQAAESDGWDVEEEVWADGVRADLVISKVGEKTRVLEAQISGLSIEDAQRRTASYEDKIGPVVWTHPGRRAWSRTLPSLQVHEEDLSQVVGGVYEDRDGQKLMKPQPLNRTVAMMLPPSQVLEYTTRDDGFGFFRPPGAPAHDRSRPGGMSGTFGGSVRECDRTPGEDLCQICRRIVASESIKVANGVWRSPSESWRVCGKCAEDFRNAETLG